MKNRININKEYKLDPLIEVIRYSKVKKNDIIIIRCEKGKENDALSSLNSQLLNIIKEKDLRILAVTPNFNATDLSIAVEAVKNFKKISQENDKPSIE